MKRILIPLIMILFAFPGAVFAAGTVETLSARVIDARTAELRGSGQTTSEGKTIMFFEYGPTQSLGRQTTSIVVLKDTPKLAQLRAFNLTPGITYYYRAVIEGTSGTSQGEIRSFVSGVKNDGEYSQTNTNTNSGNTNSGGATTGGCVTSCAGANGTNGTNGTNGINGTSGTSGNGSTAGSGGAWSLFGGSSGQNTNQTGAVANTTGGNGSGAGGTGVFAQNQNPGGFFQRLFDSFTGARPLQLSVGMTPEKPSAREIVEYTVTYSNGSNQTVGGGNIAIVLPDSVAYLADNSGGKTRISKVTGGQQLTLSTDPLSAKEKRTITVMAIAGSAVNKVPATAVASMTYANRQGVTQNISTNKTTTATPIVAATGAVTPSVSSASSDTSSGGGILPNTFFEWLMFLAVVTGAIVLIRRVMAVYQERRKRILAESKDVTPAHA